MRILIDDGMRIQLGTGIGQYSKYLYESLKEKVDADLVAYSAPTKNRKLARLMYILYINSPSFLRKCSNYDCVHFAGHFLPFIRSKKTKYIATVHDLVAFIHPETMDRTSVYLSKKKITRIMENADIVITDSKSVKTEMQKYFPAEAHKVIAIHPGHYAEVEPVNNPIFESHDLQSLNESPFFLFVGTIEKRKNIGMIIDGFFELKKEHREAAQYKLVLAGRLGFGHEEFQKKVDASPYKHDVFFTGFIGKDDCNKLYSKASAYIFPSVYEGFGSTQLECMRCHTPLILSNISTNKEVSRDYGLFFSLDNPSSLVAQMVKIVKGEYDHQLHNELADAYMREYDWNTLVDQYIDVYEGLVHESKQKR